MSDEHNDIEQIDEVSLKTAKSALTALRDPEVDYNRGNKDDAKNASKQADNISRMIKNKHGAKAASDAEKSARKAHWPEEVEYEDDSIEEESLAASSLKPGSKTVADPKSKIEAMTSVIGAMHSMRKDDLTKWYTQAMALIGKEADKLPAGASADSNASTIDMKGGKGPKTKDAMPKLNVREDVEEMFVGEELSEEFKDKASTLFEAAVNARALVEIARLEEEYEARLEEEVTSIVESVEKNVDTYLDYVVEKWMEENQVAIESSLRNEIMEEFIDGLKGLFAEHYIAVPEDKVDVVESLAAKVEELEEVLDETINENAELKSVIAEAERASIVDELAEDLTMTQSEKFVALAEGVSFEGDLDAYRAKLEVVKETYFTKKSAAPAQTNIEEETFEGEVESTTVSVDPSVNRYVQAISRTIKR